MRAAQITHYGDKDALTVNDNAAKPTPGSGQVLIEVHAAGVNPYDWKVRSGQMAGGKQLASPLILGRDVAGVITAVGENVADFHVGQEVYGQAEGSFAEFALTSSDQIASKPQSIDMTSAAALPLASVSAYQALVDTLHLSEGQKILIHGGAGGIGGFAIQLAKHLGAYVATTVSTPDIDFAKQLGADETIDYTNQKFEEILHEFDAVFDTVGSDTYSRSFDVLKPGGQMVSMLEQPNNDLMDKYHVTSYAQFTKVTRERLEAIAKLVDDKILDIVIGKAYPLNQAAEAVEYIHQAHHQGKIVIKVKD